MNKIIFIALSTLIISGCQTSSLPVMPLDTSVVQTSSSSQTVKKKDLHSATGEFQYREMASYEDIDINEVARRFLWDFDTRDVDDFSLSQPLEAKYPLRRYSISFLGNNPEKVKEALKLWQKKFAQYNT
ncbi:hypothetical protein EON78_03485, partial [bacterium]